MGVIACINESLFELSSYMRINESLFELSSYFEDWFVNSVFSSYNEWKSPVNQRIHEHENAMRLTYCACHHNLDIARNCLVNVSPWQFWSMSEFYLDLVKHFHQQVRLMGNFGLNGEVPGFQILTGLFSLSAKLKLRT